MHRTSVEGKLVHGVRLAHGDGWVAHEGAVRRAGLQDYNSSRSRFGVGVGVSECSIPGIGTRMTMVYSRKAELERLNGCL